MKLHHIALTVSVLGKSEAFYTENFGLTVAHRYAKEDIGAQAVFLSSGTAYLELFSFHKKVIGELTDLSVTGIKHVAFQTDDVSGERERLIANGLSCTEPKMGASGGTYFFTTDPDGHQIEIYENKALDV